jgi:hypothetical protein
VAVGGVCAPPLAAADELSIAFPASANPEIRRAQQTLVESWGGCADTAHARVTCRALTQHMPA